MFTEAAPGINKTINFQGKMTDDQGLNVADGNYQFVFSLYTVASGGSATWTETVNLDVTDGIFHHNLGSSTALPGSVDFDTDNIFLGITFNSDPDGEMSPRIQLTASPYAFNSDQLDGLDASDFVQLNPSVAQTGDIDITGSLTAGDLAVDTDTLVVDETNDRVGIGNAAPTVTLDVGPSTLGTSEVVQIRVGDFILQSEEGSSNGITASTSRGSNGNLTIDGASGGALYTSAFTTNNNFLVAGGGNVRIGDTNAPAEKLDVNGAIRLGTTANTNAGTIRWSGSDFEGYDGGGWVSFTSGGSGGDILQNGNSFTAAMTIGTNDAYALNFETSGTTRGSFLANGDFTVDSGTLFVDESANTVGIGTSTPTAGYDLTIGNSVGSADINFAPQAGGSVGLIFDNATGTYQLNYNGTNNSVNIEASGTTLRTNATGVTVNRNFAVDTNLLYANYSNDYVNIGSTSDLGARLAVVGSADEEQLLIRANGTQSYTNPLVLFQSSAAAEIGRLQFGNGNIGIGTSVLNARTSGTNNSIIGTNAGDAITSGSNNTALGYNAMTTETGGSYNVAIGDSAANQQNNAGGNVAVGAAALLDNIDGWNNVAIGRNASNGSGAGATRSANVVIGYNAGVAMSSADNNILLGSGAGGNITTGDNNIIIGYNLNASSASVSNELRLGGVLQGNTSTLAATFNGTLNVASTLTIGTSDTTGTLLVLDTKTDSGDPTGVNGGIYYNSNANKFRCYENSAWVNCISAGGGGGGDILQNGNSFTAAMTIGTNDSYDLNLETAGSTRLTVQADGDVAFNTDTLFVDAVNDRVGIGTAAPSQPLEVQGNVMFQTPTNSVSALEIKRQDGNKLFRVDTSNSVSVFGEYNAITGHQVFESSGTTYNISLVGQNTLTASRTIYLPDADGTICVSSGNCSGTGDISNGGNSFTGAITIGTNDAYALNLETSGTTRLSIDSSGNATFGGNFLPATDDTHNLGSNTYRWADLFLGPSTLHIGTSTSDEGAISYNTTTNNLTFDATNGVLFQNSANSTTAFSINNMSGTSLFNVDSTDSRITVGNGTTFVLGSATSDPDGVDGAMYYNTTDDKLRCYVGSAWVNCDGTSSGGAPGTISRVSRVATQSSSNYGTGSFNAGSTFTPAADTVLVAQVFVEVRSGGGTPAVGATDITISGGGLTWNAIGGERYVQDWDQAYRTFYAVVGGSPPSNMQVAVDAGSLNVEMYHVAVHEFSGVDTGTPAAGFVSGTFSGAKSGSETVGATPTTNDWVIVTVQEDSNGGGSDINIPSGWASIHSSGYTPDTESYYRTSTTSTALEFDVTNSYGWGPSIWTGFVLRASGSGGAVSGSISQGGNTFGQSVNIGSSDNYDLNLQTNGITRLTVDSGGSVGIGTTDPGSRLHVVGDGSAGVRIDRLTSDGTSVIFERAGSTVGSISVTGSATAFNTTSDYRLKENVVTLDNALARLMQLQPVRYNFIADPGTVLDGFLAHEAQGVVPEAVTGLKDAVDEHGNPIYQMIDQSKLVPLTVAAVKDLAVTTDTLSSSISLLQQQNNTQDMTILNLSGQVSNVTSATNGLSTSVNGIQTQLNNGVFSSLNISGNATIQNLTVVENLTVGNTLTVTNRIVTKNLTITGHIKTAGAQPSAVMGATVLPTGASVTINGNDSSGTITITTSAQTVAPDPNLTEVNFAASFAGTPRVMLSPANAAAVQAQIFAHAADTTTQRFRLQNIESLDPNTTYVLNYWIVE